MAFKVYRNIVGTETNGTGKHQIWNAGNDSELWIPKGLQKGTRSETWLAPEAASILADPLRPSSSRDTRVGGAPEPSQMMRLAGAGPGTGPGYRDNRARVAMGRGLTWECRGSPVPPLRTTLLPGGP
ncbi:unnamed protein product [Boreogadus saida]